MFNWFDALYQLIMLFSWLAPIAFILFAIIYGYRVLKRVEKRSEEKLQINRESVHLQRKQMEIIDQVDHQLITIEKVLKNLQ
ncbi:hypothetical protein [Fervidibacillus halotolerans]|uniref:Uncharacterized protein n=1 Tax=Fervidibacillus halotolerans TaxID=2980027 RepID=A0A9E8RZ39_9BACI|nr:hypothetical protein [Fervidibacillus halotolerans]WAA13501.1 hypothetical protein OE105_05165 [Fervidibacillus halotolerans]